MLDIIYKTGTNKFASQKGMSMGAVRHVADIRADEMNQDGQGVITLQSGDVLYFHRLSKL